MVVDKTEIEDFNNVILSKGLNPSDFEFIEHEEPMQGIYLQPIMGKVGVRRKTTSVHRSYRAGHRSHWVADFAEDLMKGVFD